MAYQDFSIDFVDRPRAQVTKDRAYTLTCKVFSDNSQVVPTSATIDVNAPGGGELTTDVSGASVTVDGNGTMTYTLAAGNADTLGANFQAVWYPVISSVTYDFYQLFDVVLYPLRNLVVQADLTAYYPNLTDVLLSGESDFQGFIEKAFTDVYMMLDANGKRPWLILSWEDLRRPIEHAALAYVFRSIADNSGRYRDLFEHHTKELHRWFQSMNFVYDITESGTADGTVGYTGHAGEEGEDVGIRWRV